MNLFEMFEQELPPEPTFITALEDFLPLCVEHLGLKRLPKITFQKDVEQGHVASFGSYDADADTIVLVIHNRQPVDILRTLAHELVHARQREVDSIQPGDWRTGSPVENEANAGAGIIMRLFAKQYPQYLSLPAVAVPNQLEEKRKRKKKSKPRGYGGYYGYYWGGNDSGDSGGGDGGGGESVQREADDVVEGGAETSWSDGTEKITLQDILELTKHIKQINLPINDNLKSKLIHWDGNPEEIERINQVTVSNQFPILIIVDEQGQIKSILDGNHRLHKAIRSQAKTIPAKLIKPSDLSDKAKRIFHIKEQGVVEGIGKSALVGVLAAALSMVASPAAAEPSDAAKALGIYRTVNRYKDYNSAALEGEANQELMNILRAIQGHPNQSKLLPIIKKMITSDDNSTEELPPMTLPDDAVQENFADGKKPGRKGLAKRVGVNTKASVSDLRKTAKNSSGEKQRMAHWLANMKSGRNK